MAKWHIDLERTRPPKTRRGAREVDDLDEIDEGQRTVKPPSGPTRTISTREAR